MAHLTLTKAKTSRISRPQAKSPIKKTASFDLKTRRILDPSEKPSKNAKDRTQSQTASKLEVTQRHLPAEMDLLFSDVLAVMKHLAFIQFPPFPEKGLGRDRVADLYNARKAIPPIVMLSQLHSVLFMHTLIERESSSLIEAGVIRKILLRGSSSGGRGGEVTGAGGEFGLILSETYAAMLSTANLQSGAFSEWASNAGRTVLSITHSNLLAQGITLEEIKKIVEAGFLTMDYSLQEDGYTMSVPGSGNFVRNLKGGRKELLRALKRQKYHEMLEKNLIAKKLRESILSYEFHLHELVGSGRVEIFMTPAGRGIRITSKGLEEVK